jgi:Bacterial Ig domain
VQTRFPPEVAVTQPPDGALLQLGQDANLAAEALDFDGPIRRVEFYGDGQLLNTDTDPPYTAVWPRPGLGRHRVRAVAYDGDNLSRAAFATYSVISNLPPAVQITSPSNMSVYLVGTDIPIEALASDPGGEVKSVEFYYIAGHDFVATEQFVAKATLPPYSATLQNLSPGAYRVFARAIDDGGLATDSGQQHIQVERSLPGPRLQVQWMGRELLMLTWDAPGAVLETADKLPGEWTSLPNAQSPYHIQPSDRARYFRLRLPPGQ